MGSSNAGKCAVCGKPGSVHFTEIRQGRKTSRSFCTGHVPPDLKDSVPFGPHRTPADEAAFLRQQLAMLDELGLDPKSRAEAEQELERLIADIEAGRRRLGDGP